jgi:hypothetical protein
MFNPFLPTTSSVLKVESSGEQSTQPILTESNSHLYQQRQQYPLPTRAQQSSPNYYQSAIRNPNDSHTDNAYLYANYDHMSAYPYMSANECHNDTGNQHNFFMNQINDTTSVRHHYSSAYSTSVNCDEVTTNAFGYRNADVSASTTVAKSNSNQCANDGAGAFLRYIRPTTKQEFLCKWYDRCDNKLCEKTFYRMEEIGLNISRNLFEKTDKKIQDLCFVNSNAFDN